MKYKTNQLDKEVLFSLENYKNIAQDFWVYKFKIDTSKVGYEYSLIDEIKQDLPNIKSVVYLRGKVFYALFERTNFADKFELENRIKELITNPSEVIFYEISNPRNFEIDNSKHFELESQRYLAQLLFNSLANTSTTENARHSNITGGLYWKVEVINSKESKEKSDNQRVAWQYITLKLELDYHLHLKLEVKTFSSMLLVNKMNFGSRKTKLTDYAQYEILPDNINSMRRLKSNQYVFPKTEEERKTLPQQVINKDKKRMSEVYIMAQTEGKKSTVSFLDFSNYENFASSKSGVLYEFLKEIKTHLSKYISVKFVELPFSDEKWHLISNFLKQ